MWYRYKESIHKTVPRIIGYQVAFYDMTRDGKCFDESHSLSKMSSGAILTLSPYIIFTS